MNKEVGKGCYWFLMRFKDYLHDFVKYFLFLLISLIHHQNFSGNQNQISTCKTKPAIRCSSTGFLLYSVFSSLGPHTLTSSQSSIVTLERLWTLSLEPTSKRSKWYFSKGRASSAAFCNKKPLETSGQVRRLVLKILERESPEDVTCICFFKDEKLFQHWSFWQIPQCVSLFSPVCRWQHLTASVHREAEAFFLVPKLTIFQSSSHSQPPPDLAMVPICPAFLALCSWSSCLCVTGTHHTALVADPGFPCTSWAGFLGISPLP